MFFLMLFSWLQTRQKKSATMLKQAGAICRTSCDEFSGQDGLGTWSPSPQKLSRLTLHATNVKKLSRLTLHLKNVLRAIFYAPNLKKCLVIPRILPESLSGSA